MKRFISSVMVVSMLATSLPAFAQDRETRMPAEALRVQVADASPPAVAPPVPAPVVPPPPANISPLVKTQPAPYTGVLFSPEAVAQVISQQDAQLQAQKLAVQNQLNIDAAQTQYAVSSLQTTCTEDESDLKAQLTASQAANAAYLKQLKSSSSGPGPVVWIGLGGVGGIVLTTLIAFAVTKASK